MSLERKDVRAKLDADDHAALKVFAEIDGVTEAEFIENILVPAIRRRVADATLAASELERLGISGRNRESAGNRIRSRR